MIKPAASIMREVDPVAGKRRLLHRFRRKAVVQIRRLAAKAAQSESGRRQLARDLQRRLALTIQVQEALSGLSGAPAPFAARLQGLAVAMTDVLSDADQVLQVHVDCDAACPPGLEMTLLLATRKLIEDVVRRGFHHRMIGTIRVRLVPGQDGVRLSVADDGWCGPHRVCTAEDLTLLQEMVAPALGRIAYRGDNGFCVTVDFPQAPILMLPSVPVTLSEQQDASEQPSPGSLRARISHSLQMWNLDALNVVLIDHATLMPSNQSPAATELAA